MSTSHLARMRTALARALSVDDVDQLGILRCNPLCPGGHDPFPRAARATARSIDAGPREATVDRQTGQSERLPTITPHRLLLSTMAAVAARKVESVADLLREFNHENDVIVAYKAFHNRLARPGFAEFMGSFVVRLTRRHDSWVHAAWLDGERLTLRTAVRLSQFIAWYRIHREVRVLPSTELQSLLGLDQLPIQNLWTERPCGG